jgi:hypothetical protein
MELGKRIAEGPIIDDKPPTRTRIPAPTGNQRPGLPAPTPRKDVLWTRPQATTSTDTGVQLNPQNPTAGSLTRNPPFNYAKLGASPTSTPGFGKISPSGTGLPEQSEFASRRRKTTQ